MKLDQDTFYILKAELYKIVYKFNIKKQHWRKYQIVQKKPYQYKYYRINGISKQVINKYKIGEY